MYNNFVNASSKTFYSGLLPKKFQFRLNPINWTLKNNLMLSIGYNLNFELSVSVASCDREKQIRESRSRV